MRVGEILLEHGWVDAPSLGRAIAEQRHAGKRLCSLLISRGLLDPDHAARALGQQHDVAAILQHHLEHRDPALTRLLPAELARTCFALPIGRNREGDVIICVRDPRRELYTAIQQALGSTFIMAVTPASQLEHLIDLAYEPSPSEEYDVDLTTGPIVAIDIELNTGPIPRISESLPDFGSMTLVELDDDRVAKDPSQSGQFVAASALRSSTILPAHPAVTASRPTSIEETITALDAAQSRDAATARAMQFAQHRWTAALLMMIKEGAAIGHRGHGTQLSPDAVQAVAIPLSAPSIVKVAHDWRRVATEPPQGSGTIQERLVKLLGQPRSPTAIPVVVATRVACVLAVGDAIGGGAPPRDLERLAAALGEAYTRIVRDKKT